LFIYIHCYVELFYIPDSLTKKKELLIFKYIIGIGLYFFYANSGETVILSHKGKEITVNINAVQSHLDHGDTLVTKLEFEIPTGGDNGE